MKRIAILILIALISQAVFAQTDVTSSSELVLQISTLPELKFAFTQNYTFPFMQGDSPLTEGNNINLALTGEITPITLNVNAKAVWTPIAFLQFSAGGLIGTGWNIGDDLTGIGLNTNVGDASVRDGGAFDGIHYKALIGGTFQFDLAAIFPGEWNHVVFQTYHEINYMGYSRASANQPWFYESDSGENMNGFSYYGNLVIGYQMPLFLNMVAFLAEANLNMYDTPGRTAWGDDLIRLTFSGILSFDITRQFSAAVLVQFRTLRNFTEETKDLYYQNRVLKTDDKLRLEFFRVAAALTYKF